MKFTAALIAIMLMILFSNVANAMETIQNFPQPKNGVPAIGTQITEQGSVFNNLFHRVYDTHFHTQNYTQAWYAHGIKNLIIFSGPSDDNPTYLDNASKVTVSEHGILTVTVSPVSQVNNYVISWYVTAESSDGLKATWVCAEINQGNASCQPTNNS